MCLQFCLFLDVTEKKNPKKQKQKKNKTKKEGKMFQWHWKLNKAIMKKNCWIPVNNGMHSDLMIYIKNDSYIYIYIYIYIYMYIVTHISIGYMLFSVITLVYACYFAWYLVSNIL